MFFGSNQFQVMEKGVCATWLQQQLHLQNLANIETPGYKAKSLVFEEVLNKEKETLSSESPEYRAKIITREDTSRRPDGNNVDSDTESVELYKAYAQYSLLLDKISGEFQKYNYVLNNEMK